MAMDLPLTDIFSSAVPSNIAGETGDTEKSQDITIYPDGDLIIRLVNEATGKRQFNGEEKKQVRILASFLVKREILAESSPQFDALLKGHFQETDESIVDIKEGTTLSLELWFRVLHDTMTDEMYTLPVNEVIEAIEVCGYRHLQISWLGEWAEEWFRRQDIEKASLKDLSRLIYPAKELDRPREFQTMTRRLVYGISDQIIDRNFTAHSHLCLEHTIIGALNGAKGNLRCKVLKGLFAPIDQFLRRSCTCKEATLFAYCQGLSKTGIWPLEYHMKKPCQQILDSFKHFACDVTENTCDGCEYLLQDTSIHEIHKTIQEHFEGLCLDCMDLSKGTSEDTKKYLRRDVFREYDSECRVSHGQPTWYWSYMGRKTEMQAHQREKHKKWNGGRAIFRRSGMRDLFN
ncbi:BTB POZ fold protein [Rutstroemia sp. NJR-2017a BVV2]|nr:BTB POZ fold protein [Rutstroemia sp. NJR-2017a BVV2]